MTEDMQSGDDAAGVAPGSASASAAGQGEQILIDVDSYASSYTGRTKVMRLRFIADKCAEMGQRSIELEALRMALDELKMGENTVLYKEVVERVGGRLGPQYELDQEWLDLVEKLAVARKEKLEAELQRSKANLIKESIRMGFNDLGDFYYARGDLQSAFKCYARTRDYCTTSKHIISMCLHVILVSIELGQFMHVLNYVQKAEKDVTDMVVLGKLQCAAGLAHLEVRKYKMAARKFVDTKFDLGNNYSEVIAPQDVATYGGLCALASFDRAELKSKVIDNVGFRNFLELVPEVRELIYDFYASRYPSCLRYLEKLRPMLSLDIHLHDHVASLYAQIRHRALIQYTTPFISVDLPTMARAFNTGVPELEKELATLIMENQVQARIDSQRKVLYARHTDQRSTTFQKALATGQTYQQDTHALLIRANLLRSDLASGGPKTLRAKP